MNTSFRCLKSQLFGALVLAALAATLPSEAEAQPSPHRRIKRGIGNCVFSNKLLNHKGDGSYKLKRRFNAPEQVYARCYYAKPLKEYKSIGKLKSQLRGTGYEPPRFNRRLQFKVPVWNYAHTIRVSGRNEKWDQTRMDIVSSGRCDFKKKPRTGRCINLEQEVRRMAKEEKASLPYTTEICVHIDFDMVDKKVPNPKNRLQLIDKKQFYTIAKGCFEYTVQ